VENAADWCRDLAIAKEVVVADRWAAARWQLVLWFSCSCVMIIVSWRWFGLGVVTGCIGLVGAVTGLRHDHTKHPILRPIKVSACLCRSLIQFVQTELPPPWYPCFRTMRC